MSLSLSTAAICFIACHGGPADHFATFAESLTQKGYQVEIHASGPALDKFQNRNFSAIPFSVDAPASEVAKKCTKASVIITDLGHSFDTFLQQELSIHAPKASRFTYYDNPESFVPGGYSDVAAQVMALAQKVLFANANLTSLAPEKGVGLGYYPMEQAKKIATRRASERETLRSQFFKSHSLEDRGQKVLVYAGGNNEEYFSKAFPAFLKFLDEATDLSNFIIVLQQHPGAKKENRDATFASGYPIFISEQNSDDAQVLADAILYYQTSMGPQFALAGIPTIQTGHAVYEDILVRNNLCSTATTADAFMNAISNLKPRAEGHEAIEKGLGIYSDWENRLEELLLR